jgi:HSP20 family molecular chaperone IbpA
VFYLPLAHHAPGPPRGAGAFELPQARLAAPAVHIARPVAARQSVTSSLIDRFFYPSRIIDTPFSLLPRMFEDEFTSALDSLNRALTGLIHVETTKDKSLLVTIDDLGMYDKVSVEFDKDKSLLVVKASSDDGNSKAERAVTVPTKVIKPEMITAETKDGNIMVTIPHEAQAPPPEMKQLKNQKLDVNIIGQGSTAQAVMEKAKESVTA